MKKYSLLDRIFPALPKLEEGTVTFDDGASQLKPVLDLGSELNGARTTVVDFTKDAVGADWNKDHPAFQFGQNLRMLIQLDNAGLTGDFGENLAKDILSMLMPGQEILMLDANQTSGKGNFGDVGTGMQTKAPAYYSVKASMTADGTWPGIAATTGAKAAVALGKDKIFRRNQKNKAKGAQTGVGEMISGNPAKYVDKESDYDTNLADVQQDWRANGIRMGFGAVVIYFDDCQAEVEAIRNKAANFVPLKDANDEYETKDVTLAVEVMNPLWLRGDMLDELRKRSDKDKRASLASLEADFLDTIKKTFKNTPLEGQEGKWDIKRGVMRKVENYQQNPQAVDSDAYETPQKGNNGKVVWNSIKHLAKEPAFVKKVARMQQQAGASGWVKVDGNGKPTELKRKCVQHSQAGLHNKILKAATQAQGNFKGAARQDAQMADDQGFDTGVKIEPIKNEITPLKGGDNIQKVLQLKLTIPFSDKIPVQDEMLGAFQEQSNIKRAYEEGTFDDKFSHVYDWECDPNILAQVQDLKDVVASYKKKDKVAPEYTQGSGIQTQEDWDQVEMYLTEAEYASLGQNDPKRNWYQQLGKKRWGDNPLDLIQDVLPGDGSEDDPNKEQRERVMGLTIVGLAGTQKSQKVLDPENPRGGAKGLEAAYKAIDKKQQAKVMQAAINLLQVSQKIFTSGNVPDILIPMKSALITLNDKDKVIPDVPEIEGFATRMNDVIFNQTARPDRRSFFTMDAIDKYKTPKKSKKAKDPAIALKPSTLMAALYALEDINNSPNNPTTDEYTLKRGTNPINVRAMMDEYRAAKSALYNALTEDYGGQGPFYTVTTKFLAPDSSAVAKGNQEGDEMGKYEQALVQSLEQDTEVVSIPTETLTAAYSTAWYPHPGASELPGEFERYGCMMSLIHPNATPEFWTDAQIKKAMQAPQFILGLSETERPDDVYQTVFADDATFKSCLAESKALIDNLFDNKRLLKPESLELFEAAIPDLHLWRSWQNVVSRLSETRRKSKRERFLASRSTANEFGQSSPEVQVSSGTPSANADDIAGVIKKDGKRPQRRRSQNTTAIKKIQSKSDTPGDIIKNAGAVIKQMMSQAGSNSMTFEDGLKWLKRQFSKLPSSVFRDGAFKTGPNEGWEAVTSKANRFIALVQFGCWYDSNKASLSAMGSGASRITAAQARQIGQVYEDVIKEKLSAVMAGKWEIESTAASTPIWGEGNSNAFMENGWDPNEICPSWARDNLNITQISVMWNPKDAPNPTLTIPNGCTKVSYLGGKTRNDRLSGAPTLAGAVAGVTELEISMCNGLTQTQVQQYITQCTAATELSFIGNDIAEIPVPNQASSIQRLELSGNPITKLPGMGSPGSVDNTFDFTTASNYSNMIYLGLGSSGIDINGIPIAVKYTDGSTKIVPASCSKDDLKSGDKPIVDAKVAWWPENILELTIGEYKKKGKGTGEASWKDINLSGASPIHQKLGNAWEPLVALKAENKTLVQMEVPTVNYLFIRSGTMTSVSAKKGDSVAKVVGAIGSSHVEKGKTKGRFGSQTAGYRRPGETLLEWSIRNGLIK